MDDDERGRARIGCFSQAGELLMLDLLFVGIGFLFLAGAMLYAVACDRL